VVLDALKSPSSKLSEKTKRELPSFERVDTTFRNINWLLQYWMCIPPIQRQHGNTDNASWDYEGCFSDPISAEFGFASVPGKGTVQWMDDAAKASD
jgi:hypothetical protein